jgi:15-cis-phytoene synthase
MAAKPSESDRDIARRITQAAGSNFTCARLILPRGRREALEAVYAFTRHTDDIADEPKYAERRTERLGQWRSLLLASLDGAPPAAIAENRTSLISAEGQAVMRNFARTCRAFDIPREPAVDLIAGCEMDLARRRYANFGELRLYCHRVAACVGLLCLPVFGAPEAIDYAENLGIAFQLTNILRDMAEDFRAGRVYLPQDEMAAAGVSEDDLARGEMTDGLRRLIRQQADRAEDFYRATEMARPSDRPRRLLAPQIMRHIYHHLLIRIRQPSYNPFGPRLTVSRLTKIRIALRTWASGR